MRRTPERRQVEERTNTHGISQSAPLEREKRFGGDLKLHLLLGHPCIAGVDPISPACPLPFLDVQPRFVGLILLPDLLAPVSIAFNDLIHIDGRSRYFDGRA